MDFSYNEKLIERAKELRKNMTKEEKHLWYDFLAKHTFKFKRQQVIDNFIVDFCCNEFKLVIELDGSHHYLDEDIHFYDEVRTMVLESFGFTVIRFSNKDVNCDFLRVCREIDRTLYTFFS